MHLLLLNKMSMVGDSLGNCSGIKHGDVAITITCVLVTVSPHVKAYSTIYAALLNVIGLNIQKPTGLSLAPYVQLHKKCNTAL